MVVKFLIEVVLKKFGGAVGKFFPKIAERFGL